MKPWKNKNSKFTEYIISPHFRRYTPPIPSSWLIWPMRKRPPDFSHADLAHIVLKQRMNKWNMTWRNAAWHLGSHNYKRKSPSVSVQSTIRDCLSATVTSNLSSAAEKLICRQCCVCWGQITVLRWPSWIKSWIKSKLLPGSLVKSASDANRQTSWWAAAFVLCFRCKIEVHKCNPRISSCCSYFAEGYN